MNSSLHTRRRHRPWPLLVGLVGVLAVATATVCVVRRAAAPRARTSLELPRERGIEARFTATAFAAYRPFAALRGASSAEPIPLAILSGFEQHEQIPELVAALASTGNVVRARAIANELPAGAAAESDRAALALAAGDTESALDHAYRALAVDPLLVTASWNLGLAARALHLPRVARDAFQRVVARGEPGWSTEARTHIAALDQELSAELEFADFMTRGRAMVAGGPLIDVADVRRFPAYARAHVLDAIRVASGPRLDELRPLARELDVLSGTHTTMELLDRAVAANPALRALFADRYRAVLAGTATTDEIRALVDELRRAGRGVDDIRAGAIIAGNQVDTYIDDLGALADAWHDPWFGLVVARVRIMMNHPRGDLRAVPALANALTPCTSDAWNLRCGQLAQELAWRLLDAGRTREAETWAKRAVDWYQRGVAASFVQSTRTLVGEIHRNLGRSALARAELEETSLATEKTNCALHRHASIALASLDLEREDWGAARERLPDPAAEKGCETDFELQALGTAVDMARSTADPADAARATRWIETVAAHEDPFSQTVALVARVRLARGTDPQLEATLMKWLADHPAAHSTAWEAAIRTWADTTLTSDLGKRHAWDAALELAATEHPGGAQAPCTVTMSLDVRTLTIAARTPAGAIGDQRTIEPDQLASIAIVPPAIAKALAQCPGIAVDARQPLHGRADLLPAELPWWFIGDAPPVAAPVKPWRAVEITSPRPPDPSLPPLPDPGPSSAHFDRSLTGDDASPSRVLAAMTDATYIEVHAHGVVSTAEDDAAFLALSPDSDGTYTLHASALRKAKLARAPIVVLAACRAAAVAAYYQMRWSLPDAFLSAGAHAVVAADVPIPDAEARHVFDELHRRIDAGEPVHEALAAIRRAAPAGSWQRHLIVFR